MIRGSAHFPSMDNLRFETLLSITRCHRQNAIPIFLCGDVVQLQSGIRTGEGILASKGGPPNSFLCVATCRVRSVSAFYNDFCQSFFCNTSPILPVGRRAGSAPTMLPSPPDLESFHATPPLPGDITITFFDAVVMYKTFFHAVTTR